MPYAAKRPCRKPGCGQLVESGFCNDHKQAGNQADRLYRGSAHSRGYDRAWQKVRVQALKRDLYLCQRCLLENRVTVAEHVHHIQKITDRSDLRLNLDNLMSVCVPCHNQFTANGE